MAHSKSHRVPRFKIYLAGPVSGCNDEQLHVWRRWVRDNAADFDVIDPAERLVGASASPYELVQSDLQAIEQSDGVLVNMWRESIGTAIGVVHARTCGKVVVVADENRLKSRMLDFYADAVVPSLGQAVKALRSLLKFEHALVVLKHGGGEEPFDRRKLVDALRFTCGKAGRHDLVVPQLVLVALAERLGGPVGKAGVRRITATDIDRHVLDLLERLESSDEHRETVKGVAAAWRAGAARKQTARVKGRGRGEDEPATATRVLAVSLASDKSHATIWGKTVKRLEDVPSAPARRLFEAIMRVEGVRDIRLTKMGSASTSRATAAELMASKTPGVIEGKLFDKGRKGNVQYFQIRVHDPLKAEVRAPGGCSQARRRRGVPSMTLELTGA